MAAWVLVPCLVQLRAEFDRVAPNRATGADGSIGDTAHQQHVSDHNADEQGAVPIHDADKKNEVHALDITTDLREPNLSLESVVQFILARCRKPNNHPDNEARLRYIIFNRRIWKAPGWVQERYTGTADPHTGHAHFSAEYVTALEADTRTWHLEEIPVALTAGDKTWLSNEIREAVGELVKATQQGTTGTITTPVGHNVLSQGIPNPITGTKTAAYELLGDIGETVAAIKATLTTP